MHPCIHVSMHTTGPNFFAIAGASQISLRHRSVLVQSATHAPAKIIGLLIGTQQCPSNASVTLNAQHSQPQMSCTGALSARPPACMHACMHAWMTCIRAAVRQTEQLSVQTPQILAANPRHPSPKKMGMRHPTHACAFTLCFPTGMLYFDWQ